MRETLTPPIKWVGGKRQIMPELLTLIPNHFNIYVEPFLGGGALWLELAPKEAIIADACTEIMCLYQIIESHPQLLIEKSDHFTFTETEFHNIRERFNNVTQHFFYCIKRSDGELLNRAVDFLYLNKTARSGLFRLNQDGKFNAPFGNYKLKRILDPENILAIHEYLKKSKIIYFYDYRQVFQEIKLKTSPKDIFVYLDPPYMGSFSSYTKEGFDYEDHVELANQLKDLQKYGIKFLLTNSAEARSLYNSFKIKKLRENRVINSDSKNRGEVGTIAVTNY